MANASAVTSGPAAHPGALTVDFHFDVMCPFAYQTSIWMRSVRDQLGLTVNWRFFSLEEVNRVEGKKHPWERDWSYGWSMMRIGALLRRTDMAWLDAWYARAGRALHEEGHKPHEPAVARHLLQEIGLDPGLVDAAIADPTTHDEVLAEHQRGIDGSATANPSPSQIPPAKQPFGCGTASRRGSSFRMCSSCSARRRRHTSGRSPLPSARTSTLATG